MDLQGRLTYLHCPLTAPPCVLRLYFSQSLALGLWTNLLNRPGNSREDRLQGLGLNLDLAGPLEAQ